MATNRRTSFFIIREVILAVIQSASNALRILESFLILGEEIGVNEVARFLDLSPAVTHRLLVTLREHGFVQQDVQTRKFRVGSKVLEIGLLCLGRESFARTALQSIQEKLPQYTAFVGIPSGDKVLIVAAAEGTSKIKMGAREGEMLQFHATAMGKALLSEMSRERVEKLMARTGMPPLTPHTIRELPALLEDMKATRERGFAINNEESVVGGISVGVTLHNLSGETLGAASVSTPKFMVTMERVHELGEELKRIAATLQGRWIGGRERA